MTDYSIKLSDIYKVKKNDRDIFQELMPLKVKEILIISSLYDSFNIQREWQFSDDIVGTYLQLRLFSAPRYTNASNVDDAIKKLNSKNFDIIIIMSGFDKNFALNICKEIKNEKFHIPILLLLNNKSLLSRYKNIIEENKEKKLFDRAFIWNGNSTLFFAMIKYIEDKKNIKNDTKLGDVRVILLVEDSIRYYSSYLPVLYSVILKQTQKVISDHNCNEELDTIFKMRVRPKILLATNYEKAIKIIKKYKDNMLCVISDMKYPCKGIKLDNAGLRLVKYIHKYAPRTKTLIQSSDFLNKEKVEKLNSTFIDKNSNVLHHNLEDFLYSELGFGNFIFKNSKGKKIIEVSTSQQFENAFKTINSDSLLYHSKRHSFSTWLMARGEINLAKKLREQKASDFKNVEAIRKFCLNAFINSKKQKIKGNILLFDKEISKFNNHIIKLSSGSLGGKGRGLAFISHLLENINFNNITPEINVKLPKTAIIGINNYIDFVEKNKIYERILFNKNRFNDKKIINIFLKHKFPPKFQKMLLSYLKIQTNPIAIRSSGLFEDSMSNPFAGLYETFFIPNNNEDILVRYNQLSDAIKTIYASIFTKKADNYFNATDFKQEEEKMAVVIQEMIGNKYENRFYPHISGVAQSYNFYPFSYIKPKDSFAILAVGLGVYAVNGEKTFRFCPNYPKLEIKEIEDVIKDSQTHFISLDLENQNFDFTKDFETHYLQRYRIKQAEIDGTLKHCASVYDANDDKLVVDFEIRGKRVVNFANILKYDYIPLADALKKVLSIFEQALAYPVEIEFAVDLNKTYNNKPSLYILQVKPFIRPENEYSINIDKIKNKKLLLKSEKIVGHGIVKNIRKVLFVKPEQFNKMETIKIGEQISKINKQLKENNEEYLLIGPGRWGSRDKYIGIPIDWVDISAAKIIIEYGLDNLPLDGSLGSHFFHNIVTMNIGYFSIKNPLKDNTIDFEMLNKQKIISETKYVKLIEFNNNINILMDAHKSIGIGYLY